MGAVYPPYFASNSYSPSTGMPIRSSHRSIPPVSKSSELGRTLERAKFHHPNFPESSLPPIPVNMISSHHSSRSSSVDVPLPHSSSRSHCPTSVDIIHQSPYGGDHGGRRRGNGQTDSDTDNELPPWMKRMSDGGSSTFGRSFDSHRDLASPISFRGSVEEDPANSNPPPAYPQLDETYCEFEMDDDDGDDTPFFSHDNELSVSQLRLGGPRSSPGNNPELLSTQQRHLLAAQARAGRIRDSGYGSMSPPDFFRGQRRARPSAATISTDIESHTGRSRSRSRQRESDTLPLKEGRHRHRSSHPDQDPDQLSAHLSALSLRRQKGQGSRRHSFAAPAGSPQPPITMANASYSPNTAYQRHRHTVGNASRSAHNHQPSAEDLESLASTNVSLLSVLEKRKFVSKIQAFGPETHRITTLISRLRGTDTIITGGFATMPSVEVFCSNQTAFIVNPNLTVDEMMVSIVDGVQRAFLEPSL